MKIIKEHFFCDVCKTEIESNYNVYVSVIVTTETSQEKVEPYLDQFKLDLCSECKCRVFDGNMIFASLEMGDYKFEFKNSVGAK